MHFSALKIHEIVLIRSLNRMFIRIAKIPAKKIINFSELNYVSPGKLALTRRDEKDSINPKIRQQNMQYYSFSGSQDRFNKKNDPAPVFLCVLTMCDLLILPGFTVFNTQKMAFDILHEPDNFS